MPFQLDSPAPKKEQPMATFTVILEQITEFIPYIPKFYGTETIEVKTLDEAWDQAREKWYIRKELGPLIQIADIKVGEWHPPAPESKGASDGEGSEDN